MKIIDTFAIVFNFISVIIYYIVIIYNYDKYEDSKKESVSIVGKYIGIPFLLLCVGFIPAVGIIIYLLYVLLIGTVNIIRGRKFLLDIETFGFFKDVDN